jgi:hypothetical protein
VARYFTPDEANEALAEARPLAEQMVACRRALAAAVERRAKLSTRIAGNGGGIDAERLRRLDAELEQESKAVARCVLELTELGAQVKDLDRGLLDFPARRGEEEVLLCWEVGEEEIRFWHGLEEGFAGRKPLPL